MSTVSYAAVQKQMKNHGIDLNLDDVIASSITTSEKDLSLIAYSLVSGERKVTKVSIPITQKQGLSLHNSIEKSISYDPPHLFANPNRRVIMLVNPFSGQKRALELWNDHGKLIMETAGIQVDIVVTVRPGHATDVVKDLNIFKYDAILVNSGDGLFNEVLNGILLRKDRKMAFKIPICPIPGGTSNALAAAILYNSNEPFSSRDVFIKECTLLAVRPRYIPLRLFSVDTEHNGRKSMFLSASWGLIADIDIGSERFRFAGMARLHIEAIIRILKLPSVAKYKGKISYIPVEDKEIVKKSRLNHYCDRKAFGEGHFDTPEVEKVNMGDTEICRNMEIRDNKTIDKNLCFDTVGEALNSSCVRVPPLNEPLPNNWKTIEGEFVMVNVTSISHLGSDLPFMPSAQFGEPIVYITLIDWAILKSRFEVADLFIRMNRGVHLSYPCFQIIPAKAVRVEPITKTGYFAIDGESCQNGSAFQVVPQDFCATIIGRKHVV